MLGDVFVVFWIHFLLLAEYWYNSSFHSSIGMTPFEALYSRPPPSLLVYVPGTSKIQALNKIVTQKIEILKLLKYNLNRARNRMVQQANLKRSNKSFTEGQWVYHKLQPYRQISMKSRASHKLSK